MNVRSYDFNNKKQRLLDWVKRILAGKRVRIVLLMLSGALLLAAAAVFVIQWNEGEIAAEKAGQLLSEANMQPSLAAEGYFPAGIYEQPEGPDAQSEEEIAGILATELQGYTVIARLDIEKLGLQLPALSQTSNKALKVSVCYYSGPGPGEDGNLVITGHNYRSGAHFGKLDQMEVGDTVALTDVKGNTYTYKVYKTELIRPDNPEAFDKTKYDNELTLFTCEANGNRRLFVHCASKTLLD